MFGAAFAAEGGKLTEDEEQNEKRHLHAKLGFCKTNSWVFSGANTPVVGLVDFCKSCGDGNHAPNSVLGPFGR